MVKAALVVTPIALLVGFAAVAFLGWDDSAEQNLRNSIDKVAETQTGLYQFTIDQCGDEYKEFRTLCCCDPEYAVLGGVDVVEMYNLYEFDLPKIGDEQYAAYLPTSSGFYRFLFINEENLETFKEDPWSYAPAWGGFCGYGVALEEKSYAADFVKTLGPFVDLSSWAIKGGRLYFFGGSGARLKFIVYGSHAVALGDENWGTYYDSGSHYDGHFNTNCFHRQTYEDLINGIVTGE
uniref:TLDc domain-containing protein n=1 Tax=Fibrocapsa japonica TaxID=94617 RepID=A0A7S2V0M0_9STRA|mmetsp:Transcript_22381/g.32501  ORF Transcript_22381/g.32501 Transcript_22381/m.32501 type:complete len:236 (+) Transcript_22381:72-779(+)|eukprot:CAMPEP_0113942880 /NCGR_PEP_ID=MMETSP1339-20121228/13990_1 /TAXON_ID=94617 /ORGANISM="Fibrocapsa japonica" /LENGTH=235 /DNA_ID=CAMNT_0000947553 /DNA_START=70 /DNA_END=777 /DNA_ORIENTATION=+ /assembly_acc=CAM_ASM_000762